MKEHEGRPCRFSAGVICNWVVCAKNSAEKIFFGATRENVVGDFGPIVLEEDSPIEKRQAPRLFSSSWSFDVGCQSRNFIYFDALLCYYCCQFQGTDKSDLATIRKNFRRRRSNKRPVKSSQELLAVWHRSTRVQRTGKEEESPSQEEALSGACGRSSRFVDPGGMSARVRRRGRGIAI